MASPQKKGPAEAATSPSRGSTKTLEGLEMNSTTNSTAATGAASGVNLEDALHDLLNMTTIASELATDDLGGSHITITGNPDFYHLSRTQRERLLFSIHHVKQMASQMVDAYERGALA